jgi:hypothetical protein
MFLERLEELVDGDRNRGPRHETFLIGLGVRHCSGRVAGSASLEQVFSKPCVAKELALA